MKKGSNLEWDTTVTLELISENGAIKDKREIHNSVTNAGLYGILDQMLASPTLSKATHMELGTGTGGTTALSSYISGSRTAFTSKNRSNNVVTIIADFGAGIGTGAITEAGTFDSATQNSGNMWMYSTFAVINKAASDTLKITWTLTLS